ncbi:MAG: N-6 DNA methylase [Campylobacter sp.]|nr:N-6 DNA methylase [Campylobacter sp.]
MGQICTQKKLSLNLDEIPSPKNPKKLNKTEREKLEAIHEYKDFLLKLKIIDPACGSGAFLNQALNFLIHEHEFVDKNRRIYDGDALGFYDIEASILENNLYGVDINKEATDIAKLSLWLRTAKRGRKLTQLAKKIKCANSLTQMPFFDIEFDCVIGNPPYVRQEAIKDYKDSLSQYQTYSGTADLYVYFYELGLKLLKPNGILGYICSNKFFRTAYGQNLREFILNDFSIDVIADFNGVKVFEDATVDSAITIIKNTPVQAEHSFEIYDANLKDSFFMLQSNLSIESFSFLSDLELGIKKKIESLGTPLKEWEVNIYRGILTGYNKAFKIDEATKDELIKKTTNQLR